VARRVAGPEDLRTRLAELSGWQTATRDDARVAEELHAVRAMDRVYPLNTASFFDELFHYIREIGAWPLVEGLDPRDRVGPLYPFVQFVLVTIMRCVGGVQSMLATQDVLLTDDALMTLVGFNAAQVRQGSNDRGTSRRTRPVEIRGALVVRDDRGQHREGGPGEARGPVQRGDPLPGRAGSVRQAHRGVARRDRRRGDTDLQDRHRRRGAERHPGKATGRACQQARQEDQGDGLRLEDLAGPGWSWSRCRRSRWR